MYLLFVGRKKPLPVVMYAHCMLMVEFFASCMLCVFMQEAFLAEKEKHDKLIQEMREKYKESQDSLASRFNDTLKLKENLERKVKDLECEV